MGPIFSHWKPVFLLLTSMIRKVTIMFSLCCVVLCAIVGYLSYQVTQESEKAVGIAQEMTCLELIKSPPGETARLEVKEYLSGKRYATTDWDGDGQWESVCIPLFPRQRQMHGIGLSAVLVLFKNVPDKETLDELVHSGTLDVNYWPARQSLNLATHSDLSQKYINLDFASSPILYYGYEAENPVLGETSMIISAGIATVAIFIAFLALVSGWLFKKRPQKPDPIPEDTPTTNRAGLPDGSSPSILDQMASARSAMGK